MLFVSASMYCDDNEHNLHIIDDTTDYDGNISPLPPIPITPPIKPLNIHYFGNYHYRNTNIPSEMNILLDRIENDLQFIFKESILKETNRSKQLYALIVELHENISKYHRKFILPFIRSQIIELNNIYSLIIKLFEKFRRCKTMKNNGISQLKDGVDSLLNKIAVYNETIIDGIHCSKQLISIFNGNIKLLLFWISLFPKTETKYHSMTWTKFVDKIRENRTCRKLKKFPSNDMMKILQQKYNIPHSTKSITTQQFVQYLNNYNSINVWSKAIYIYIDNKISNNKHKQSILSPNSTISDISSTMLSSPLLLGSESSYALPLSEDDDIITPNMDRTSSISSPRIKYNDNNIHSPISPRELLKLDEISPSNRDGISKYKKNNRMKNSRSNPTLGKYQRSPPLPKYQIMRRNHSNQSLRNIKNLRNDRNRRLNKKNSRKFKVKPHLIKTTKLFSYSSTEECTPTNRPKFNNTKCLNMPRFSLNEYESDLTAGDSADSCYGSIFTADNEFGIDEESHPGYSVSKTPKTNVSPKTFRKEPFKTISLQKVSEDLQEKRIIYHGLFKVYSPVIGSYIDTAGILTADRLYLVSGIKYQIWEEFRERSKIDILINGKLKNEEDRINTEMAWKLIKNIDIMEQDKASRLLPYFVGNTKKEIMLSILLNELSRDKMKKLSSYFHLDHDMYERNDILHLAIDTELIEAEPSKDMKYVKIKGINDGDIVAEKLRDELLEDIMDDIEWSKEEVLGDSIIMTLRKYHYGDSIIQRMNDRKCAYFVKKGLLNGDKVEISEYDGDKIQYTFTELKVIELKKYENVCSEDMYDEVNCYGFCINPQKKKGDELLVRMNSNNSRFEWITHIDFVLYTMNKIKDDDGEKKEEIKEEEGKWINNDLMLNNSSYFPDDLYHFDFNEADYEEIKEEEEHILNEDDVIMIYSPTKQKLINDFTEKKKDEENKEQKECEYSSHFNFGIYLNYWQQGYENSVIAKYDTLKDELLKNNISFISEDDYYQLYEQCVQLMKIKGFMIRAKHIGPNNKKFNIPKGSIISINHLIALKIYTDYTKSQNLFKKHCRRYNDMESMQDLIERNSEIANWCRYLRESCSFFGTKMENKYVYTGLKDKLIFSSLTQNFYCPLSTTVSISVAQNYCGDHGVILKLKTAHAKCRYFDVSWLSRYKFEEERLIMGAAMKICDIFINSEKSKNYISALQLLEQILNGYQFDTNIEIEEELYQILGKLLKLNNYFIPEYIEKLLNKQIEKMINQKMIKKIWINQSAIQQQLKNSKLKCILNGCIDCMNGCGINMDHECGAFFHHFDINLNDINNVTPFRWKIDKNYETFKDMKARKFVKSCNFDYYINDTEKVSFHIRCYPKYTNESEKCALFLHINSLPIHVESIKVEFDLLCDYGAKNKYQHLMIPQVMSKYKEYCGWQTFSSKKIKYQYMIWNIGIKIIEVNKYKNNNNNNDINSDHDMECNQDLNDLTCSVSELEYQQNYDKNQLIQLLINANQHIQNLQMELENIKSKIDR